MLNKFNAAAIIGYWRSGASKEEIVELSSIPSVFVERIIYEYENREINQGEKRCLRHDHEIWLSKMREKYLNT